MFDIETFRRTRLEYEWSDSTGAFRHNYGNDWHVFIIWHEAAPHFASILSDLAHDFVIRFIATHQWNPEKLRENTARFYPRRSVRVASHRSLSRTGIRATGTTAPSPVKSCS
jgi:hypothetical protein